MAKVFPGLFNIFSLSGGSAEFSSDLALHCVLELPSESGEIPRGPVDLDHVADDEARLFYQPLNGGQEPVFNALQRENTELLTWHRFQIISWTLQIHRDHPIISPKQLQPHFFYFENGHEIWDSLYFERDSQRSKAVSTQYYATRNSRSMFKKSFGSRRYHP